MMLIFIAITMFILIVASTWWFGLWSNLITLVNLLLASMLASICFEPVSMKLLSLNSSYRYLYDFIAVWLVFLLAFVVLRAVTDVLSGYRLKFDPITELVGRSVLSIWIAGVFVCFSFFTLQMAPLKPGVYAENVPKSEMGTIPDRLWLSFIQSRSRGALAASKDSNFLFASYGLADHRDDVEIDARVFDPRGEFLPYYSQKRRAIADRTVLRVGGK
ncbi:hypothetical protein OAK98_00390 [Mariniblastus sp.]|nr:hypothetical protein [Mariniblastus sp.]